MNKGLMISQYAGAALLALIAYSISGQISQRSALNYTLRLCNERPDECKFKYDILRYNEEGIVPQTSKQVQVQPTKK